MSAMSGFLKEKLLNHVLRSTTYSSPGTVYVALFETDPAGTAIELSGGGYSRKSVNFNDPSPDEVTNDGDIIFDTATSDWNTVNYVAIMSDSTGGDLLFSVELTTGIDVLKDDNLKIEDGKMTVRL